MNDHNLDDLIIDTIAPKTNKSKSFLTIIALFIIVLIVAIILTRTLLKSPENNELSFEKNLSGMIAPELQLQESTIEKPTEVAKPKEEESLSHIIEETVSVPKNVQEEIQEEVKKPEIEQEKIKDIKEEVKEEIKKPVPKPVEKETQKPQVTPNKPKPKEEVKKEEVKEEVKKPSSQPAKRSTEKPKVPKTSTTGRYYVQVSSFKSTSPSSRLLSVIKSSGFTSHISAPDRTGYKKLLIGPYKTRTEVDKAKDIIRDRILKSAFVVER